MRTMKERSKKDSLIQFWQNHSEAIAALGYNLILAIVIWVASSLIAKAVCKAIQDTNSKLNKVDATLIPIFSTVASYAVYVIKEINLFILIVSVFQNVLYMLEGSVLMVTFKLMQVMKNGLKLSS